MCINSIEYIINFLFVGGGNVAHQKNNLATEQKSLQSLHSLPIMQDNQIYMLFIAHFEENYFHILSIIITNELGKRADVLLGHKLPCSQYYLKEFS